MSIHVPVSVLDVNENIFEMLKKAEIFVKNNTKSTEAFDGNSHSCFVNC